MGKWVGTREQRILARIDRLSPCWLWTGSIDRNGYGRYDKGYAHRLVYEILVGPIPDGMELDHVKARGCTNKHCVNPAHLEPVTKKVNVLRGDGPTAINSRKTHCKHGHPLLPENLYTDKRGWRACRLCTLARQHRHYHATKEAA